jgi:hypothetical protein
MRRNKSPTRKTSGETLEQIKERIEQQNRNKFNRVVDFILPTLAAITSAVFFVRGGVNPLIATASGVFMGVALRYVFGSPSSVENNETRVGEPVSRKGDERQADLQKSLKLESGLGRRQKENAAVIPDGIMPLPGNSAMTTSAAVPLSGSAKGRVKG